MEKFFSLATRLKPLCQLSGTLAGQRQFIWSTLRFVSASSNAKPRITVPHRMMRRIERSNDKLSIQRARERASNSGGRGAVLIACKRSQFNHRVGQSYRDFNPEHLASKGWKHDKSKGDYFTINAVRKNAAFEYDSSVFSTGKVEDGRQITFQQLNLNKQLVAALGKSNITCATNIQAKTIPQMMSGKNILCTAETGSGKTLAYVLPILEGILRHNSLHGSCPTPNKPYALVLAPSRELAYQVHDVLKGLSEHLKINVDIKCGGGRTQLLLRRLPLSLVDVVVTTPGVLSKLLTNKFYDLSRLSFIIVDEADTMLDDSFNELTIRILQKLKVVSEMPVSTLTRTSAQTGCTQIALVGATLPRSLNSILGDIVSTDTIETISTDSIHRIMPHVAQKFIRLGPSQKDVQLLDHLKSSAVRNSPTLIFCNNSKTVCYLGYFLESNGIPNIIFHSRMPQKVREGRYERFLEGQVNVMVCTDVASRGLDTVKVRHIINYEFPHFMSDYIHRVGRIGRVGSEGAGVAVSFITHPWDVELLWKIETAARKNDELHNVNANIKRTLIYRNDAENNQTLVRNQEH